MIVQSIDATSLEKGNDANALKRRKQAFRIDSKRMQVLQEKRSGRHHDERNI